MKRSGVLMHISSLPSGYGCGSFGIPAYKFIDLLAESGFSIWQTLPFGWPDEYGSPYKAISAFAGNPYFIDLPTLRHEGLITDAELASAAEKNPYNCEFQRLQEERIPLLFSASRRVSIDERIKVEEFIESHKHLADFCIFMAKKSANGNAIWQSFDESVEIDPDCLFMHKFIQYKFYTQWMMIKSYAASRGISIIGDLPIYPDLDSSDVYANPDLFLLDENYRPTAVAGVPPDYFSPDGQLWGNPLYDFTAMKADGYKWWLDRLSWQLTLFDGVRIDHFRAFSEFFAVPADSMLPKDGHWQKGPGLQFVRLLKKAAGDRLIIAEDLGDIDEKVVSLLERSGLPGMRVFQFAFVSDDSVHKPHLYPENCVAYSGTHDNNTLLGYLWEASGGEKSQICDYIGYPPDRWQSACPEIMKTLLRSPADRVIFPIQDILGYGSDTRMNKPGTSSDNWAFRVTEDQLAAIDRSRFHYLNKMFSRCK